MEIGLSLELLEQAVRFQDFFQLRFEIELLQIAS